VGIINDRLALLITADAAQAVREIEKVGRSAERDLGKATAGTDKFANTALKAGAAMVGFGAVVGGALFQAAQASSVAQVADEKLNNSLTNSPKLAGANRQAFVDLAQAIQRYSVVDDEAVKTTEATLAQFGLTEKQILALTPLVVDLSRKMGIDLDAASKAVGKAVEGNVGGLQRMGIIIKTTAGGTVDFNTVLDALKGKVGGFAEAEGKTFEGQLARIKNQLHDVEEGVGVGVVQAFGNVLGPVSRVSVAFNQLDDGTKATVGRFATIGTATVGAIGALGLLAGTVRKLQDAFRGSDGEINNFGRAAGTLGTVGAIAGTVVVLAESFNALDAKINQLQHGEANLPKIAGDLADFAKSGQAAGELTKQFGTNLDDLVSKLDTIQHYGPKGPSILPHIAGDAITGYTDAKKDVDALDKSLAALVASGRPDLAAAAHDRLADAVRNGGGSVKDFDHELNDYHKALDAATFASKTTGGATQDLTDDVTGLAAAVKTATASLDTSVSAVRALEQADARVTDTQKALTEAQGAGARKAKDVADANRDLADAERSIKTAVDALNDARRQAPRDLAKAKTDEATAAHQLEQATNDAAAALLRYGAGSKQAIDAADKLAAAQEGHVDAADKLNTLQKDAGHPKSVQDAEQRLADAKQSQIDSQEKLNKAKAEDPAAEVAKAEQDATDAAQARQQAYDKVLTLQGAINTALGHSVDLTNTTRANLDQIVNDLLKIQSTGAQPFNAGAPAPFSPAAGPVGKASTVPAPVTNNTTINVTVPPGTDADLATRVGQSVNWAQHTRSG
jgi:hypothetical protein